MLLSKQKRHWVSLLVYFNRFMAPKAIYTETLCTISSWAMDPPGPTLEPPMALSRQGAGCEKPDYMQHLFVPKVLHPVCRCIRYRYKRNRLYSTLYVGLQLKQNGRPYKATQQTNLTNVLCKILSRLLVPFSYFTTQITHCQSKILLRSYIKILFHEIRFLCKILIILLRQ